MERLQLNLPCSHRDRLCDFGRLGKIRRAQLAYRDRMTEDIVINEAITIPASELRWQFSKSSGPGGQSVNTTDSRVSLSFDLSRSRAFPTYLRDRAMERLRNRLVGGQITVHSSAERSQLQNRAAAADRLAQLLREAVAVPPPKRRATRPSRSSKERRIAGKKQRGETKRLRGSVEDH